MPIDQAAIGFRGSWAVSKTLVHNSDEACIQPLPWSSGDTLGHGHAKLRHDVDDLAGDGTFGLLRWQSPGVEAAADHSLLAHRRDLAQRPTAVVHRLLPAEPTTLLDHPEVSVPLRGHRLSRSARHRR